MTQRCRRRHCVMGYMQKQAIGKAGRMAWCEVDTPDPSFNWSSITSHCAANCDRDDSS